MHWDERIQRTIFWKVLLKTLRFLMILSTVLVTVILGVVVLFRYVLYKNFIGYEEFVLVGAFWMYFIGAAYSSFRETEIKADFLAVFVSKKTSLIVSLISKIIQVILGIPLVILAVQMLLFDLEFNPVTVIWKIPLLVPQSAILIGYLLMLLFSIVYLSRDIRKYKAGIYE
ncbi:MAG: TRAP transporter small permease [Thermovirgaceae bacterium]|nr:TRAP transporter small permease [Synergistales bacterium]HPC76045.1 TRAP transporter small permease [Synergistales bacterium]HRS48816.1 TRAP transporter small permease [Thermovirgaceae bacterium]HRU90860.1 TRAP transporter small permease [Thermovirgaceae bacterium]